MATHVFQDLKALTAKGDWAFYLDDPEKGTWIAGIGAQSVFETEGPTRALAIQEWMSHQSTAAPFFPTAFTFESKTISRQAAATTFIPKKTFSGTLALNAPITTSFKFPYPITNQSFIEPANGYLSAAEKALKLINAHLIAKIILACGTCIQTPDVIDPWDMASWLKQQYPTCQTLVWITPYGEHFVAATPERLISKTGSIITTEALAGTAPRGLTEAEDAFLGQQLLNNPKEILEHEVVCQQIIHHLQSLGLSPTLSPRILRKLPFLQHILTPIQAIGHTPILELLHHLHPTAAVCGLPTSKAQMLIPELEGFHRGFYAGAFGFAQASGDGHFCVGLRGTTLRDHEATFFAGAGIVKDSQPLAELNEIKLKLISLQR